MEREVDIRGRKMRIAADPDDRYLEEIAQAFETEVSFLLPHLLTEDAVIADVGANLGVLTLFCASLAPRGHVHAFEPHPRVFSFLEHNVRANKFRNVSVHQLALGAQPGEVTFWVNPTLPSGSFVVDEATDLMRRQMVPVGETMGPDGGTIAVRCVTLDDVVAENEIDRLDLLKIDTEGWDVDVLRGAKQTLSALRPGVIVEFATFALTMHRQILPADALEEIRGLFDRVFVVLPNGQLWEVAGDGEAFTLLQANAGLWPVFDLFGVYEDSRVAQRIEQLVTHELPGRLEVIRGHSLELQRELAEKHDHVKKLDGELKAMRKTLSWRVTAPLRGVRRLTRSR